MYKKKIVLLSVLLYFTVSCVNTNTSSEGEVEDVIREEFSYNDFYYIIKDIVKVRTLSNVSYMDTISTFAKRIEEYKKVINDSSVISLLVPELSSINSENEIYMFQTKQEFTEYKIVAISKFEKIKDQDFFTLVSQTDGPITASPLVEKFEELDLVKDFNILKTRYNNVLTKLEALTHKTKEELALMCKEEKERQETARIAAEKARAEAERIEAEKNKPINSWKDVAEIINKKVKLLGIWEDRRDYGLTIAMYQKGNNYYWTICEMSKNPLDWNNETQIFKKKNSTYIWKHEGSDMPEKYVISGKKMNYYVFNPDAPGISGEWVYMGTYTKIY